MNKSDDWIISIRLYKLLINKLSNTVISDIISIQHKCESDYKYNTVFYKS